jgi:hypothetical protein
MAIYIVRELKTSRANKLKLGTLFAFGGLSVQPNRHRPLSLATEANRFVLELGYWGLSE